MRRLDPVPPRGYAGRGFDPDWPQLGGAYATLRVLLPVLQARSVDHADDQRARAGRDLPELREPRPGATARDVLLKDIAEELSRSRAQAARGEPATVPSAPRDRRDPCRPFELQRQRCQARDGEDAG